jgi:hypothetical protein
MNMTLSHNAVVQNFPECEGMRINEVRVVTDVPASTREGGTTTLEITRWTDEYYDVKEAV